MTSTRAWWIACVISGAVVLVITVVFALIPDVVGCGPLVAGNAVITFEIARTPADMAALFGDEPCRSGFITAMRRVLWIDALGYIPAYTIFLVSALMALRKNGRAVAIAGAVMVLAAAVIDQAEGYYSFAIIADLPGEQSDIDGLILTVRAKFALLGLAAMAIGWLLLKRGSAVIGYVLVTLGGMLMLVGVSADERAIFLGLGGAISWITLFVLAVIYWRRPDTAPSP